MRVVVQRKCRISEIIKSGQVFIIECILKWLGVSFNRQRVLYNEQNDCIVYHWFSTLEVLSFVYTSPCNFFGVNKDSE